MTLESLAALIGFAFVTSITPGPSNLILLTTGLNYGFRKSLPLAFGVSLSFLSMLVMVGLGLGRVLQTHPGIFLALRLLCLLYVFYLAWKIAWSRPDKEVGDDSGTKPVTFLQAAALQWVNPKAWAVAMIVTVAYSTPGHSLAGLLGLTLVFGLVNLPSISLWAVFGLFFKRLIKDPVKIRVFNLVMAVLLAASMIPLILNMA